MSIDEVLNSFDYSTVWKNQRIQRKFLEQILKQNLDNTHMAKSSFRGTVLDFGMDSYSGEEGYAINSSTTNSYLKGESITLMRWFS